MQIASFKDSLEFNDKRINSKVILESLFTKELGIALKKGQVMKEHQTRFPIVVHILQGHINFGVKGVVHSLKAGSLIALEGNVPHDLTALEDSIVRLTLSKSDQVERVAQVVRESSS